MSLIQASHVYLQRAKGNNSLETDICLLAIAAGLAGTLLVLHGNSSLEDVEITKQHLRLIITSFRENC